MRKPRFKPLAVEQRGYTVVRIFDHALEKEFVVYRRGSRYLYWDRRDARVENPTLRKVAREALEGAGA